MGVFLMYILFLALGLILGAGGTALYFRPRDAALEAENAQQKTLLHDLAGKCAALELDVRAASDSAARSGAERDALQREIAQRKEDEQTLIARFENLSNRIFEEKSEKFRRQSQEGLNLMLTPLKEKLGEFQKKVDDSFGDQAKEQRSLKDQIKNIVEANAKMTLQAETLASALKGESKVQGNWGEYILEKILEDSGLRQGEDYILQGESLDLVHPDTGGRQRPDVIINLPENKHIVVDSKLSLTHYERFFSEADDTVRPTHLQAFLASVRDRVRELEKARYQDTDKLGTPDVVLMFMPIEGAYALAVQQDPALHEFAWNKRVVIVCPTTLFATLKTVASLWRLERQNRNAQEIAKRGGALYDKMSGLLDDMAKLGNQLKGLEKTYDGAMNKLLTGRGAIVGNVEKLKELGAKTSRALPKRFFDGENTAESIENAAVEEAEEYLDLETGT